MVEKISWLSMVKYRNAERNCLATLITSSTEHTMKVISFLATLPSKLINSPKPDKKILTLKNYIAGVNTVGDQGTVSTELRYQPCDVAVMLGWVHEQGKRAPHLSLRQEIVDKQRSNGGRVVIADSNLFLYANNANPYYYLRYSFDGVFPNTGEYCDQIPDLSRWPEISNHMGVSIKPWRANGNHILICLQRNGGWSMGKHEVTKWATETIKNIRQFSNRPIVIRPHPGDKNSAQHLNVIQNIVNRLKYCDITIGNSDISLVSDLNNCWAVVNHNSSPTVGAVIEGVPVFVTDPARSQCWDVANTDFSRIENPLMPDRTNWINRISQFHWSHAELISGRCWNHMRQWVKR